jgi:hypothetical protein
MQAYKVGDRVKHPELGEGVIVELKKGVIDPYYVRFDGTKRRHKQRFYAKQLEKIDDSLEVRGE